MSRMHTAIRLNQVIKEHSIDSKLVILNLPGPPKDASGEKSCILATHVNNNHLYNNYNQPVSFIISDQ